MWKIIFLVSVLTGCIDINKAPISKLYIIDIENQKCVERIITDKSTLASRQTVEYPLEKCDGNVSLTMKEFLNLRTFMKENK